MSAAAGPGSEAQLCPHYSTPHLCPLSPSRFCLQLLIAKGLKKAPTAAAPAGEAEEGSEAVVEGATAVEQPALAAAAPAAAQAAAPPAQALAQAGRQAEGQAVGQAQVGQGQQGGADQGAPR